MIARPHDPADMLTQVAAVAYDEKATCPRYLDCVATWMGGDADKIEYLQRLGGYCLIGGNPARAFPVWYGAGRNGKSVNADTWRGLMGDYATVAPRGFLAQKFTDEHPCELATLRGKRLVVASETRPNMELSVDLVKLMTGESTMTARFMRQDYFQFKVTHKVILMTNTLPVIRDTSDSIWDRVQLLEWPVRIPDNQVDTQLGDKLRAEWPGILNWLLEGTRKVQADGWDLKPPAVVRAATQQYRVDSDTLGRFADECLILDDPALTTPVRQLRKVYDEWAEANCEAAKMPARVFNAWFRQKGKRDGNKKIGGKAAKCWFGVGLHQEAVTVSNGNQEL